MQKYNYSIEISTKEGMWYPADMTHNMLTNVILISCLSNLIDMTI